MAVHLLDLQLSCSWNSRITLSFIHLTWLHVTGSGVIGLRPVILSALFSITSPAVHINDILYIETPSIHPQRGILRVQTQKNDQLPVGLITHLAEPALLTHEGWV